MENEGIKYEGSQSGDEPESRTNLIINYLPQTLQDDEFFKIFCEIGPIKSSRIMRDNKTGYSFGFGFIDYQSADAATKAVAQLNNFPVAHKRIKVSYARPPGATIKETNLYVQNIPKDYSEDDLEGLFAQYGSIVQRTILKDRSSGESKGVGFVRFDKKHEADTALAQLNGYNLSGHNTPLQVRLAEEHGKQKAAYYAGYMAGKVNDEDMGYESNMGYEMDMPMPRGMGMGHRGPRPSFGRGRGGYGGGFGNGQSYRQPGMTQFGSSFGGMPGKVGNFRPNKRFNPLQNESTDFNSGYGDYNPQPRGGFRGGARGQSRGGYSGAKFNPGAGFAGSFYGS